MTRDCGGLIRNLQRMEGWLIDLRTARDVLKRVNQEYFQYTTSLPARESLSVDALILRIELLITDTKAKIFDESRMDLNELRSREEVRS